MPWPAVLVGTGAAIKSAASFVSVTRNATYTMTGLTAYTRYYVFCYT